VAGAVRTRRDGMLVGSQVRRFAGSQVRRFAGCPCPRLRGVGSRGSAMMSVHPRPTLSFRGGQNIRADIWFGALRSAVSPLPLTPSPTRSLGADRKAVRHDHEPLWDATRVRRSHPAPKMGAGPGVRVNTRIPTPQAPNLPTCSVRP
jgi:hypothetical protein